MSFGRPYIMATEGCIHDGWLLLRPKDENNIDREFYYYLLGSDVLQRRFATQAAGSAVRNLNIDLVAAVDVQVPPLHEQRRIAEILSSVDEAIAATRAVIEQTRKVKQAVLERLLTKGIGHVSFKQTEIGEIPEGWEVVNLIEVCEDVKVGIASSATHAYRPKGVPLLRNQNIMAGWLDTSDLLFVSSEYDLKNASKRVKTGDVVTMRTGYPGRSAVISEQFNGCQTFTTLITRPLESRLDAFFLCAWINSERGMAQIRKRQAGGAQQNLNAGVLKRMPVPLPKINEQREISKLTQALVFDEEMELAALNATKSALMSDLLTGRKRVTDTLPMAAE